MDKFMRWLLLELRNFSPFILAILLILIVRLPFRSDGLGMVIPHVSLIFVYYWTIHKPGLLPLWAVFVLGLLEDLLNGGTVGASSLILVLLASFLPDQRRFFVNRPFVEIWMGFMVISIGTFILFWLFSSFHVGFMLPISASLTQMLVTIAMYPILSWVFGRYERLVLR